jgi:glucose/arabinose dehydrogenase
MQRVALGIMLAVGAAACGRVDRADNSSVGRVGDSAVSAGAVAGATSGVTDTAATGGCASDNAGLTLASGACAGVFADSLMHARHVAVAPNGDVYVTLEGTQPTTAKAKAGAPASPPPASFVALRDTNHDGRADLIRRVGTLGNTGVAVANGYLFIDEGARIVRYQRADTALVPAGTREVVVDGLPLEPGHRARNLAISPRGDLFVNVGSATNSCQQKDRALASPGVDPCVELRTRAGIWRFDASRTGQRFSPDARYATGIRNAMGLTVGPDGQLYATQHGRDQLHDNWPKVFPTTGYQAENPGEELLQVNQGDDFGWPYCYYAMDKRHLVDAPEYGGDGSRTERCASMKAPIAVFPGHWAPMSLFMYPAGGNAPQGYQNGAFIAFHGSWNRAPEQQAGYRVVFQPLKGGATNGDYVTFADGFAGLAADQVQPDRAQHRPVGIAAMPDGSLIITDDAGGRIYRVRVR